MRYGIALLTFLAAAALVPLAIRWDDLLVVCMAGLIPFIADWRAGRLE